MFALLGPNGAGKTTIVRILATLIGADADQAWVAGFDVVADRRRVRRAISLTGQFAAVDDLQTGEENLHMMGRLRRAVPPPHGLTKNLQAADPTWTNSTVLGGDVVEEVAKLRQRRAGDIVIHGSAQLVQTLVEHDLIDGVGGSNPVRFSP